MQWPPARTRFVQPEPQLFIPGDQLVELPVLPRNAFDDAEDWDPYEDESDARPPLSPGCEWEGLAPDG